MKVIPIGVDYGTLVFGVIVVLADETVLAWTDHDTDCEITVDGDTYTLRSNPGFTIESLVSTAGLGVDNTEIHIIAGDDLTRADILSRKADGAKVFFFRFNWKDPSAGYIAIKRGSFGNFRPRQGEFIVEFRDIRQALQPNSTWVFQETCRWRLGDARCGVDLVYFTFDAEVTTTDTQYSFTASDLDTSDFDDDYFAEGELQWVTGLNVGTPGHKVKAFAAGVVTMSEAAVFEIDSGDEFTIIAGCRKRWEEDCKTKFDNLLNFGGEKDKPTRDELIAPSSEEPA